MGAVNPGCPFSQRGNIMKKLYLLFLLAVFWVSPLFGQGEPFRCTVTVSTATTITAVGGDCAGTAAISLWVTDIVGSSSAAAVTTADTMMTLKYGTGTTCGTGTTVFFVALHEANTTFHHSFLTPIRIPAANDLCWINSTAGTKTWVLTGFKRPG